MKKPEVMAPAGDQTCLQAALDAGADAVVETGADHDFGKDRFAALLCELVHLRLEKIAALPGIGVDGTEE